LLKITPDDKVEILGAGPERKKVTVRTKSLKR